MSKILITISALCMMFCSSCISSQVNYTINGTAHGMDGKMIYLGTEEGERTLIDSTIISNSSFTFKGTQPKICFASLSIGKIETIVVLEDGTINVSLDNHGKVTGTPTNDILNACNEKIDAVSNERKTIIEQIYELEEDQIDEIANLEKKLDKITDKRNSVIKECINQNLNNIVAAHLLDRYNKYADILSSKEFDEIIANASPIVKEHSYTKEVIKLYEGIRRSEVGQKFTDFKMKDPNDKEVSLSDYIGKGKYVLIDFWASWCGPCWGEMPNVKAIYEKFKSKGFEIVGVSLDNRKENWLSSIKDLKWAHMSDLKGGQSEGVKVYGVTGIPSTLLIDPNGIIIAKNLMGEALEKKLSELLN